MSESYITVPIDDVGKKLRTWTDGTTHSEVVVLSLADGANTLIDPRMIRITGSDATLSVSGSGIYTQASAAMVTGSVNINNLPTVYTVMNSGSSKDSISLGGTINLVLNSGAIILALSGTTKIKVSDIGMSPNSAGLHWFYFGTTTGSTQTKMLMSCSGSGTFHQTYPRERISDAGDALYIISTVAETGLVYDVSYIQE